MTTTHQVTKSYMVFLSLVFAYWTNSDILFVCLVTISEGEPWKDHNYRLPPWILKMLIFPYFINHKPQVSESSTVNVGPRAQLIHKCNIRSDLDRTNGGPHLGDLITYTHFVIQIYHSNGIIISSTEGHLNSHKSLIIPFSVAKSNIK